MMDSSFDTDTAAAEVIRHDDEYSGVRITLTATLASAKLTSYRVVAVLGHTYPLCQCSRGLDRYIRSPGRGAGGAAP